MNTVDLKQFTIQRPEKIRWLYDVSLTDILNNLRSKSFSKIYKNIDKILESNGITFEHVILNEDQYFTWWDHYTKVMTQKGYDVIATKEWFTQKHNEGKLVGAFFFYQHGKLAGSSLYVRRGSEVTGTYKTSLDVPELSHTHGASGALIDFVVLRELLKERLTYLSFGSMRNAFGVLNSVGNLEYKLSMGYHPVPKEETTLVDEVPIDSEGRVIFFGFHKGIFQLFGLKRSSDPHTFRSDRMKSDKIPFSVITYG